MDSRGIIGRQIAAARVLSGVSQARLARRASIPILTLKLIEANDGVPAGLDAETHAVCAALEMLGVDFIAEDGGGPGVRLKYNRSDVRQLDRLESEGGLTADDDI